VTDFVLFFLPAHISGCLVLKIRTLIMSLWSPPAPSGGGDGSDTFSAATLEGVRRGDGEALAEFFDTYFDLIYSLAYRLLGNRHTAEDVTQEVFLRVQRAAGSLDTGKDPRPWLRTITTNICRDHWRSFEAKLARKAVVADDPEVPGPALTADTPQADARLLEEEKQAHVQRAIMELPEDLREIVILRDYEGLDHQAIAEIVDASHAAVRKRYSRALTRLGELLQDEWP
jgi:RNA polymerase sigma-70 factor (ECF subfamily)